MVLFNRFLILLVLSVFVVGCGGGGGGSGSETTSDTTPDAFSFADQSNVSQSTIISSDPITVAGIDADATISITDGEYAIDGGAFTSGAGTIAAGQQVVVRVTSGSGFQATAASTLTIGGVSDEFSVITAADDVAPAANIIFPPAVSLTDAKTVTVVGSASDNNTITTLRLNSVDAATSDAFANWSAQIPLGVGPNTLTAEVSDIALNTNASADSVTINAGGPPLVRPTSIALDNANSRLLITEFPLPGEKYVVALDLATGAREIFSSKAVPDDVNPIASPGHIVVDAANDRALLSDFGLNAILSIDLSTGERTVFSSATFPDSNNAIGQVGNMALDATNNKLYVIDGIFDDRKIISIALDTGVRDVLSSNADPVDPNGLDFAINPNDRLGGLELDLANNRLLVLDREFNRYHIKAVDLDTGARSILSSADNLSATIVDDVTPSGSDGVNPFNDPRDMEIDAANNRVLVSNFTGNSIIAVDLTTGARTVLSDNATPSADNPFDDPDGFVLDSVNNRALMLNQTSVLAVDLASGARTIFVSNSTPDVNNLFRRPFDIAMDAANSRALVVDPTLDAVVAVDPDTGARSIVSSNSLPAGATKFSGPLGLAVDSDRALVVDESLAAVIAVDLDSGVRELFSDNAKSGGANPFSTPEAIAIDVANGRALVVDSGIIAVDLVSGVPTVFSDASVPNADNAFSSPRKIVIDAANNRALVTDSILNSVVAVSLSDGSRTILSDNTSSGPAFSFPFGLALDSEKNRILVLDSDLGVDSIIAVDLTTGDKTLFSDSAGPNQFSVPRAITLDRESGRFLVVDEASDAVFAVEPNSGERVILSK